MEFELYDRKSGKVVWTHFYSQSEPVQGKEISAVVTAFDVIHNFFEPRPARRSRDEVRRELGLRGEVLLFHSSNLRAPKRIDLLLEVAARIRPRDAFKLVILAGDSFAPFQGEVRRLGFAGSGDRARKSQRHRGLPPSRRSGTLHLAVGNLLPQYFGGDVSCLSERLQPRRRHPGSGRAQRQRNSGPLWRRRGDGRLGGRIDSRPGRPPPNWASPRKAARAIYFPPPSSSRATRPFTTGSVVNKLPMTNFQLAIFNPENPIRYCARPIIKNLPSSIWHW